MRNLCEEFKHFEGQPVKIFTDDKRVYTGIDLNAYEDAVRIIDDCGRLILIEYAHIDAVVEPQMRLKRCCHVRDCDDEFDGRRDDDDDRRDNGRSRCEELQY